MPFNNAVLRSDVCVAIDTIDTPDVPRSTGLSGSNRRAHERLTVAELSWLEDVRLKYGPSVSLIDLSSGGTQIETTSSKLQPGNTVVVEFAGEDRYFAVPCRVLRCQVSGLSPRLTYRGALAFKRAFAMPTDSAGHHAKDANANLVHEHARLSQALHRLYEAHGRSMAGLGDGVANVSDGVLIATLALIDAPSTPESGASFARELNRLFRAITRWIEEDGSLDDLVASVSERLHRAIPTRAIRLLDGAAPYAPATADSVFFDLPAGDGGAIGGRLLVEFAPGSPLEEWHLKFLKTAAQLIGLTKEVDRLRRAAVSKRGAGMSMIEIAGLSEAANTLDIASAGQMPGATQLAGAAHMAGAAGGNDSKEALQGWHRFVVRYLDGRMIKGFGRDFLPGKGHVHVWPEPEATSERRITVPLKHLKAVFFVHDFDGEPVKMVSYQPAAGQQTSGSGRRLVVTFKDGEELAGTTLNYTANGAGFFVVPSDTTSNNERVFVVQSAVHHVEFK